MRLCPIEEKIRHKVKAFCMRAQHSVETSKCQDDSPSEHFILIHFYSKVFMFSDRLLSIKMWFLILRTWPGSIFQPFEQKLFQWLNLFSIFQFFSWTDNLLCRHFNLSPGTQRKTILPTDWSNWDQQSGLVLCFLFIFIIYAH